MKRFFKIFLFIFTVLFLTICAGCYHLDEIENYERLRCYAKDFALNTKPEEINGYMRHRRSRFNKPIYEVDISDCGDSIIDPIYIKDLHEKYLRISDNIKTCQNPQNIQQYIDTLNSFKNCINNIYDIKNPNKKRKVYNAHIVFISGKHYNFRIIVDSNNCPLMTDIELYQYVRDFNKEISDCEKELLDNCNERIEYEKN